MQLQICNTSAKDSMPLLEKRFPADYNLVSACNWRTAAHTHSWSCALPDNSNVWSLLLTFRDLARSSAAWSVRPQSGKQYHVCQCHRTWWLSVRGHSCLYAPANLMPVIVLSLRAADSVCTSLSSSCPEKLKKPEIDAGSSPVIWARRLSNAVVIFAKCTNSATSVCRRWRLRDVQTARC